MPEILEIEMYRRGAESLIGRRIEAIDAPDEWYLKKTDAVELSAVLVGSAITGTARIGKLLVLETTSMPLGLRFGMTGRLVIDQIPIIDVLEYSSARLAPEWVRFGLDFDDGTRTEINDPRRLGGVSLDPNLAVLGVDAWSVTASTLTEAIGRRVIAIKAVLLNQSRLAGLGNLLVDEVLWRVGIAPGRPADELAPSEITDLAAAIPVMLNELLDRGGSHRGDHVELRENGARCDRDGGPMQHATIGGRSTWWCPTHQR